ncbi:uncharacterized protein ACWYII_012924 [Salvelinus alpinus]
MARSREQEGPLSVAHEQVCHVASRDLCLGIITDAEELSGLEPHTIILYTFTLRKHWSSTLLMFSQNRSISCAMCAGIPMSYRNSGIQTNSSHTGTYQLNEDDAIELPPAH